MHIAEEIITCVADFIDMYRCLDGVKFSFILGKYSSIFGFERHLFHKEKYNEKAKQYFRSVWYVKNRDKILKKQKEYRDSRPKTYKRKVEVEPYILNPSLIVSFE